MEFGLINNSGFHITFGNGYTVSVHWGAGTYSHKIKDSYPFIKSKDAEVAIWHESDCEFIDPQRFIDENLNNWGDDVAGYVKPEQVATIIANVSKLPRPVYLGRMARPQ